MKHKHLSNTERSEIRILMNKGYSHREIAGVLGRSQSSISREIQRNSTLKGYEPQTAKTKARNRRKRSKYQGMKVEQRPELKLYLVSKLEQQWTPEQIAGRLKQVDTHLPYISAKGIYKWLYSSWGQRYCPLLPKRRYTPKKKRGNKSKREMIPNRIGIENRPPGATNRSRYGHYEEDTMVSGRNTSSTAAVAVLSERKALYTKLRKMKDMRPQTHNEAQRKMSQKLKIQTITYDNGIENKHHQRIAQELSVKTFFCHPYSSWEKGTVENTIGRIRRFIPKGADISTYTDQQIQQIEDWLNHTPRKCLNFLTPYEIMTKNLRFISSPQ